MGCTTSENGDERRGEEERSVFWGFFLVVVVVVFVFVFSSSGLFPSSDSQKTRIEVVVQRRGD